MQTAISICLSGGRCRPGRYPSPASSVLLRRHEKTWTRDEAHSALFQNLGLVSSAVFSDLDQDGYPELIVACEWGPLKIFRNSRGRFTPWNRVGLLFLSQPSTLNPQPIDRLVDERRHLRPR